MMDEGPRILLIEPDSRRRERLESALRAAGAALVICASPPPQPLADPFDGVLLALECFAPSVIPALQARDPLLQVVVVAGGQLGQQALRELGRARVRDLAVVSNDDQAASCVARLLVAVEHRALRLQPHRVAEDIAGSADAVQQVRRYIARAAASEENVLITGETGTGKELVARAIHRHGARRQAPFVAVNCSAIPDTLAESELFGHERGSFSGAIGRTRGFLEQAAGGTLFLDEIGDMPAATQAKILHVLQPPPGASATTREFARVGGEDRLRVDVRVLAATHCDLGAAVEGGGFREDLLQRLSVLSIRIPALRERGDDIELLARLFLEQAASGAARKLWFDDAALSVLRAHDWPRNVRQLEAVVRSIVAEKEQDGAIVLGDLPDHVFGAAERPATEAPGPMLRLLDDVVREHVMRVLSHCGGNKTKAAGILGLSRPALDRRLDGWR